MIRRNKLFLVFASLVAAVVLFSASVSESQETMVASIMLEWDAVTTNEDGTPLLDLGGYRVYMSTTEILDSTPKENPMAEVANSATRVKIPLPDNKIGDIFYFRATAFDTSGNEGGYSNQLALIVGDSIPPGAVMKLRCVGFTASVSLVKLLGCEVTVTAQ